jgi:hypothetical protein
MGCGIRPGILRGVPRAQQRLEVTEARQSQMMAFLSKALQNPGMLQQLVSSRQNIGRLENGTSSRGARELLFPHAHNSTFRQAPAFVLFVPFPF